MALAPPAETAAAFGTGPPGHDVRLAPRRARRHVLHTFAKNHRLMVQICSTWFPLVDRNPQKFVQNIFLAKESDFQKATQRVYRSGQQASYVALPILTSAK